MSEKTQEQYGWSRKVASLALHGIESTDQLKKPTEETREVRRNLLIFGDYDPAYSAALSKLTTESQEVKMGSIQWLLGKALQKVGLDKKVWEMGVKMTIRDSKAKESIEVVDALLGAVDNLPDLIERDLQAGKVQEELISDLKSVSEGIKAGDMLLKTKIVVDAVRTAFVGVDIGLGDQRDFIVKVIERTMSAVNNIGPRNIDAGVLRNLQDYGLIDYLPVHRYFDLEGSATGYGKAYKNNAIDEYRAKPKPDQIGAPYEERLMAYTQEVRVYRNDRENVVRMLNKFGNHYKDETFERGYDTSWVRKNLGEIRTEVEKTISSESMRNITEFSKHPKVASYERSDLRGSMDIEGWKKAIEVALDYAEQNDTTSADKLLESALLSFRDNVMGLYNIEEAKK